MIYLASPYSHRSVEVRDQRFRQACVAAGKLMKQGHVVFSPIAHTHPIAELVDLPKDWAFWARQDLFFLSESDRLVVLRLAGWQESRGVRAEIKYAEDQGIPVEYMDAE